MSEQSEKDIRAEQVTGVGGDVENSQLINASNSTVHVSNSVTNHFVQSPSDPESTEIQFQDVRVLLEEARAELAEQQANAEVTIVDI